MCKSEKKVSLSAAEDDYEIRHHGMDPRRPSASCAVYVLRLLSGIEEPRKKAGTGPASKKETESTDR